MSNLLRTIFIIGILIFVFLLFVWQMSSLLQIRLLDLENYLLASRMLLHQQNPYGSVEFFAPPWFALFLLPLVNLPLEFSASIWLLLNLACIVIVVILSLNWLGRKSSSEKIFFTTIIPILMPGALISYITGQVTPVVAAAILFIAWGITTSHIRAWLIFICLLLATLKPHIVVLPGLICLLELIRKKQWRVILMIAIGIIIIVGLLSIWIPDWLPSIIESWIGGDYKGGRPGLISAGYVGLRELGIPVWIFLPVLLYTLWRWRMDGLSPYVFSLALCVNLLIVPYSRVYDFVVLIFPLLSLTELRQKQDYFIMLLSMISIFVLSFTILSLLIPVLFMLALLFKHALNSQIARPVFGRR